MTSEAAANRAPTVVEPSSSELDALLTTFRSRLEAGEVASADDTSLIVGAFELSAAAHQGQYRKSGEAYIHHPLAVAQIVAGQGLDATTISAALLHDAVEDTGVELADLVDQFGPDVAAIVDGVTKLERAKFSSKEAQTGATLRKLMVAMAKDLRVIVIKLADRLHNLRTVAAMPVWKQARVAQETLDVYVPLAHRLGMQEMKTQLEDLCFAALHPRRYAEIDAMVASRDPERRLSIDQITGEVADLLQREAGIKGTVTGRPKTLWSIYEKMVVKGREFDEINDLIGIRIIVESETECYGALGLLHSRWRPVQGRFKDYVAMPKFNLYQSLHTTVVGPRGKPVEFQIRTRDMHATAEFGVAAHFNYKGDTGALADGAWLDRIIQWESDATDPTEFMTKLKLELDKDEVVCFSPQGKPITLPVGATPIDFAYAIHTEVGHACVGARIDGRLVPLDSELSAGDTVEIIRSKSQGKGPSRDWLDMVATHRAADKIRHWFSRARREDLVAGGRDAVEDALRRSGLPVQRLLRSDVLKEVAAELNYVDLDALFTGVAESHVSAKAVAGRVRRRIEGEPSADEQLATPVQRPRRPRRPGQTVGVHVEGMDDVLVRLARCCAPVPGDMITGFVTRGRGVSVHRADCADGVSLSTAHVDRVIEVEWDADAAASYSTHVEVRAYDRARLLMDVSGVLSDLQLNIVSCDSQTGSDRMTVMRFEVELGEIGQLGPALAQINALDSVYAAYRVQPQTPRQKS